jgi:hypothetical protein
MCVCVCVCVCVYGGSCLLHYMFKNICSHPLLDARSMLQSEQSNVSPNTSQCHLGWQRKTRLAMLENSWEPLALITCLPTMGVCFLQRHKEIMSRQIHNFQLGLQSQQERPCQGPLDIGSRANTRPRLWPSPCAWHWLHGRTAWAETGEQGIHQGKLANIKEARKTPTPQLITLGGWASGAGCSHIALASCL